VNSIRRGISTGIPRHMRWPIGNYPSWKEWYLYQSRKFPHLLEKPGNKKIKQVELVSKWGPYIPDEYKKGSQMIYLTRM
jgi:hypothetical protein